MDAQQESRYCYTDDSHKRYAKYLDNLNKEYLYKEVFVPYVDMISGKRKKYYIDFVIIGDVVEWVEVTKLLKPIDKRIYASRQAKIAGVTYRCLTTDEIKVVYG
jgi:hypothetical protein